MISAGRKFFLSDFIKHSDQLRLANCSGNLVDDLAPLEQYEGWDGPDTVFPRGSRVIIYVHLGNLNFTGIFFGKLFKRNLVEVFIPYFLVPFFIESPPA